MEQQTDQKFVDFKKYDKFYRGATVIGLCSDGWIVYSKECRDHEHFFQVINEAIDQQDVVDVRVELVNPIWGSQDTRGDK